MKMNPLANLYNGTPTKTTTSSNIPQMQAGALPSSEPMYQAKVATAPTPVFAGAVVPPSQPPTPATPAAPVNDLYAKYRDPKTGEVMSPEEYSVYLGGKVPKGTGQIPNYAGDAMTKPGESTEGLMGRATDLNNARNDIATGETDPYGVGNKSGIAYSPAELKAIESAYAGVYDPAIKDVFSRLRDKQDEEETKAKREERVFATNESIRQWKATTGSRSSSSGSSSEKSNFTQTQINNGASNSGLSMDAFTSLDDDIKNFYINPQMGTNEEGKKVPKYELFKDDLLAIENGNLDSQILLDEISNGSLPTSVKHYFISQIPENVVAEEEKESWLDKIWNRMPFVD